jgi:hypothetical protein
MIALSVRSDQVLTASALAREKKRQRDRGKLGAKRKACFYTSSSWKKYQPKNQPAGQDISS